MSGPLSLPWWRATPLSRKELRGDATHYVAVPDGADERVVRSFASFTDELHAMAAWLKSCAVDTVAMEATGVYWIPGFEGLDRAGWEVHLFCSP